MRFLSPGRETRVGAAGLGFAWAATTALQASAMQSIVVAALSADPVERRKGEDGLRASERQPGHTLRMLKCLAGQAASVVPPPAALFCAQAVQKSLRRAPLPELDEALAAVLLAATREAAARGWQAGLIQLCLACAVTAIRAGETTLLAAFDGNSSAVERLAALQLLALVAEELHSPASKISVAPARPAALRAALVSQADATLATLHRWFEEAAAAAAASQRLQPAQAEAAAHSAAAVLRAVGAWCACGLLGAESAAASPLLSRCAAGALANSRTAVDAAEAACAAIELAEPSGLPMLRLLACLLPHLQALDAGSRAVAAVVAQGCVALAGAASAAPPEADPLLEAWLDLLVAATARLPPEDAGVALEAWVAVGDVAAEEEAGEERGGAAPPGGRRVVLRTMRAARPRLLSALLGSSLLPPDLMAVTEAQREAWLDLREEQRAVLRSAVFPPSAAGRASGAADELTAQLWGWGSEALAHAPCAGVGGCGAAAPAAAPPAAAAPPPWLVVEATLHAASGAVRAAGTRPCPALEALVTALPRVVQYAALLCSTSPGGGSGGGGAEPLAGRALLGAALVLTGALSAWLGGESNRRLVPPLLPALLWSLSVPEEHEQSWPAAGWDVRSKQEHAGAVALFKLASSSPGALLSPALSFRQLAAALHAACSSPPHRACASSQPRPRRGHSSEWPLGAGSARLLLQAAAAVGAAAAATGEVAVDVVDALLSPVLDRLAAAASQRHAGGEAALEALGSLHALLMAWPPALAEEGAAALTPHAECIGVLLSADPRLAEAACDVAAAALKGFGGHAAPLLLAWAPGLAARFDSSLAAARAETAPAAASATAASRGVLRVGRALVQHGAGLPAEALEAGRALLRHFAERLISAASHAAEAEQAILADWFELCGSGGAIFARVLVSLSTWMPSWLLGDAASSLWAMRNGHGPAEFGRWLHEALAHADVPRPGLSAEAKMAFAKQLLDATAWSAFKAALKQLCGGKKRGERRASSD
ncbi:hypothetical protein EMIHUDRAFT_470194 [Emiliania huxleyi CCMP1516]|uniref:Uncharacterized protein n=2 Tax=Emiliania huxleyi TaxID=2903 RepID=A0A0D3J5E0_EMIH1|nr:hypothetical protein EMIHUDRAFT_470194 [Emiliania huxleyi CCMP1516]EOD18725.1 hypothetical protein EMIHUDRAFT_470194 [Emiliania huxleyi CCMP1516]|eukprot:XP_005771154.1 hypothetical protein EMIHUDRAFT_470194 [Emiliania huxleyi CCMP1516]